MLILETKNLSFMTEDLSAYGHAFNHRPYGGTNIWNKMKNSFSSNDKPSRSHNHEAANSGHGKSNYEQEINDFFDKEIGT
jgi:hypothetical protein